MGGSRDRISLSQIGDASAGIALSVFDAAKAQCYLPQDRQKLLAVIEAGFGDLVPFNRVVRGLLSGEHEKVAPAHPHGGETQLFAV